ncbi:hypothetical protein E5Q_06515 [Mixia osmundae IAM 14324]|uniref:Uncharacterized protein n=1 Tax=Mixia osmundae (strain CBS 9802 / IAM 14324 / JCM 22182 / KY 12970) TaxID=764103 RepID=G7EAF2_MIXOS|nr:hypothetical protein E5Q_06515 [Mixia osmundae IAM 14324]
MRLTSTRALQNLRTVAPARAFSVSARSQAHKDPEEQQQAKDTSKEGKDHSSQHTHSEAAIKSHQHDQSPQDLAKQGQAKAQKEHPEAKLSEIAHHAAAVTLEPVLRPHTYRAGLIWHTTSSREALNEAAALYRHGQHPGLVAEKWRRCIVCTLPSACRASRSAAVSIRSSSISQRQSRAVVKIRLLRLIVTSQRACRKVAEREAGLHSFISPKTRSPSRLSLQGPRRRRPSHQSRLLAFALIWSAVQASIIASIIRHDPCLVLQEPSDISQTTSMTSASAVPAPYLHPVALRSGASSSPTAVAKAQYDNNHLRTSVPVDSDAGRDALAQQPGAQDASVCGRMSPDDEHSRPSSPPQSSSSSKSFFRSRLHLSGSKDRASASPPRLVSPTSSQEGKKRAHQSISHGNSSDVDEANDAADVRPSTATGQPIRDVSMDIEPAWYGLNPLPLSETPLHPACAPRSVRELAPEAKFNQSRASISTTPTMRRAPQDANDATERFETQDDEDAETFSSAPTSPPTGAHATLWNPRHVSTLSNDSIISSASTATLDSGYSGRTRESRSTSASSSFSASLSSHSSAPTSAPPAIPNCFAPIYTLTAKQYAYLASQAPCLETPEHVVFDWLHGADQAGTQQAAYFGYTGNKRAPVPRFRGLTTICAGSDVVRRPRANTSVSYNSIASSFASSSASSSSYSLSLSESDTGRSINDAEMPNYGPEPRPALLVSSLFPEELLINESDWQTSVFAKPQLPPTVNLRNFKIQAIKYATVSDIVVYSERGALNDGGEALNVARRFADAQLAMAHERHWMGESDVLEYRVYVITDPFSAFESTPELAELVAVDSLGWPTQRRINFFEREREEMRALTQASEIATNVWLGNTQDVPISQEVLEAHRNSAQYSSSDSASSLSMLDDGNPHHFSICVEAHDSCGLINKRDLAVFDHDLLNLEKAALQELQDSYHLTPSGLPGTTSVDCDTNVLKTNAANIVHLECQSGAWIWGRPSGLIDLVLWLYQQANPMTGSERLAKRVLIHCSDGYVDSSILALAYIMYAQGCTLPEAYLHLQNERDRSFYVSGKDVQHLLKVHEQLEPLYRARQRDEQARSAQAAHQKMLEAQPKIEPVPKRSFFSVHSHRQATPTTTSPPALSPKASSSSLFSTPQAAAPWFFDERFDGHFPSRILPYLYLGNLNHASNALMLKELGINHVVSIGESALVPPQHHSMMPFSFGQPKVRTDGRTPINSLWHEQRQGNIAVLDIKGCSDDGIDDIGAHFATAIDFIDKARREGGKVLVHCRVGVSRSATLVIAHIMEHLELDLASAYLLVRSRRLNILIQPTLLFMWSLQRFEADLERRRQEQATTSPGLALQLSPRQASAEAEEMRSFVEARRSGPLSWPYFCREVSNLNARYLS